MTSEQANPPAPFPPEPPPEPAAPYHAPAGNATDQIREAPEIVTNLTSFSPTFGKLAGAMAKAQAAMEQPQKTKSATVNYYNKKTKTWTPRTYKYCDIADILKAALPHTGKNGIAFFQFPMAWRQAEGFYYDDQDNRRPMIRTITGIRSVAVHESGEWVENIIEATCDGIGPQALASTHTYLRRYGGQMIFGIAGEADDDNGNGDGDANGEQEVPPGAATGPSVGRASNSPQADGTFTHVGAVEDAKIETVGGGNQKWRVRIAGLPGWADTLNKVMGPNMTRERGTNVPFKWTLQKKGPVVDVLNFTPASVPGEPE